METNEISMILDVKLSLHDKRPESMYFKSWTRCEVKIEAIKCLPCFLRINIKRLDEQEEQNQKCLSLSINVPGVSLSLATSRTKQYTYGIFWTQNRRDCFIYFALETEASCRRHMKWLKKSIKNLELYRQVFLEQRRSSREQGGCCLNFAQGVASASAAVFNTAIGSPTANELVRNNNSSKSMATFIALGPLPKTPDAHNVTNDSLYQRVSEIYEEIFDGSQISDTPQRLSRRSSRTSIASGIYAEMKPVANTNFKSIVEEILEIQPPLPPLPPPRKRINTFEKDGILGEIPRSNTNPESEFAKKKKYRNVLDNLFGGGGGGARSKRADSVGEPQSYTADDLLNASPKITNASPRTPTAIAANFFHSDIFAIRRSKKKSSIASNAILESKRNSFSSPDLSKLNFVEETLDEQKIPPHNSFSTNDCDLDVSNDSLMDIIDDIPSDVTNQNKFLLCSPESLNISERISTNFNFSACNTSKINLIGANGATSSSEETKKKNKIFLDDPSGYCLMAPIENVNAQQQQQQQPQVTSATVPVVESNSSGYSTRSQTSSTTSSNSNEDHLYHRSALPPNGKPSIMPNKECVVYMNVEPKSSTPSTMATEDSVVYMKMHGSLNSTNDSSIKVDEKLAKLMRGILPAVDSDGFTGNLYENLLTIKAAMELEHLSPQPIQMSTSTPTDSPQIASENAATTLAAPAQAEVAEEYYQTPRRSIISIDDKIPSYYPNSCDTVKMRRRSVSPKNGTKTTPPTSTQSVAVSERMASSMGARNLTNVRVRQDNFFISSPQKIMEQRHKSTSSKSVKSSSSSSSPLAILNSKAKLTKAAQKISENVYAVTNLGKKVNKCAEVEFADDAKEKLQTELLQLAMLQKIDFKFDDAKSSPPSSLQAHPHDDAAEEEEEEAENTPVEPVYVNCPLPSDNTKGSFQKYVTLRANANVDGADADYISPQRAVSLSQRYLQQNQTANTISTCITPNNSSKTNAMTPTDATSESTSSAAASTGGISGDPHQSKDGKKFASLPRFKRIDFSPFKLKITNVLQRNHQPDMP